MKYIPVLILAGLSALAVAATSCSSTEPAAPKPTGAEGSFQILVAPWEVDSNADYACFAISVTDAKGSLVWEDASICTDAFGIGDDGTLGYVGLCDAGAGSSSNQVRLSLINLVDDDGVELGNWGDSPPTFVDDFICNVNSDTVVRAAFVVLTQGTKGFLDVSIQVDEIECNAKIDCRDDFLSTGPDAGPQGTLIVGFTCDTDYLFMDDVTITCLDELDASVTVTLDPSGGPGFLDGYPEEFVFGFMTNYGNSTDGESAFWNLTVGISPGWHDCHISARMTASNGDFGNANDYPMIIAREVAFGFDAENGFSCTHPLDGDDGGIVTDWDDDPDYDNCLSPDETTPDDVTDVIVEDCDDGDPDPQDECAEGQSDPDGDLVCECNEGTSDPDGDGVCTPIVFECDEGTSDPDGDLVCECDEGTSDPDGDGVCEPDDEGCTYSQGYWKTHCESAHNPSQNLDWPAPEDESTLICGVTWISVLQSSGGGAWTILARQWIAARLNFANGASAPDAIIDGVAEAEVILTTNCAGIPMGEERTAALELSFELDDYNNGVTGPGHCDCDTCD